MKNPFNTQHPAKWYKYVIYLILLIFLVLFISIIVTLIVFGIKDIRLFFNGHKLQGNYFDQTEFPITYAMIVTMVATMTALSGPTIALYWSIKQDRRNVISLTYALIKEWREPALAESTFLITNYFELRQNYDQAKFELYEYASKRENIKLRRAITKTLNYLEAVATAYRKGHIDRKLTHSYFESVFLSYHDRFLPYIRSARNNPTLTIFADDITAELYSDFTNLIKKWKNKHKKNKREKNKHKWY